MSRTTDFLGEMQRRLREAEGKEKPATWGGGPDAGWVRTFGAPEKDPLSLVPETDPLASGAESEACHHGQRRADCSECDDEEEQAHRDDPSLASGDPAALAQAARETEEIERVAGAMERRSPPRIGPVTIEDMHAAARADASGSLPGARAPESANGPLPEVASPGSGDHDVKPDNVIQDERNYAVCMALGMGEQPSELRIRPVGSVSVEDMRAAASLDVSDDYICEHGLPWILCSAWHDGDLERKEAFERRVAENSAGLPQESASTTGAALAVECNLASDEYKKHHGSVAVPPDGWPLEFRGMRFVRNADLSDPPEMTSEIAAALAAEGKAASEEFMARTRGMERNHDDEIIENYDLRAKVTALEARVRTLTEEHDRAESHAKRAEHVAAARQVAIDDLTLQLGAVQAEAIQLRAALDTEAAFARTRSEDLRKMSARLDEVIEERHSAVRRIEALQTCARSTQGAVEETAAMFSVPHLSTSRDTLIRVQYRIAELQREYSKATNSRDRWEKSARKAEQARKPTGQDVVRHLRDAIKRATKPKRGVERARRTK